EPGGDPRRAVRALLPQPRVRVDGVHPGGGGGGGAGCRPRAARRGRAGAHRPGRADRVRGGASRLRASPALALLLGGLLAACDPCSGVLACAEEPRLNVEGQMVEHWSAEPVEGVEVQFVPTGGVALEEGTVTASSGGRGVFRLSARAAEPGGGAGDLAVPPPGGSRSLPPYRVSGVRLRTAGGRGAGTRRGRRLGDPYCPEAGAR